MSIMLPNFGALQSHKLRNSAEQIIERIDFGRQRAVMTGIPHRLAIDLDSGTYRLEWQGDGAGQRDGFGQRDGSGQRDGFGKAASQLKPNIEPAMIETDMGPQLSLAPPPAIERSFQSISGPLGRLEQLGGGVEFGWVETPGGDIDFGDAFIIFEGDGTSSYTMLVLNEPGGHELALEILPLADAVRIIDEDF